MRWQKRQAGFHTCAHGYECKSAGIDPAHQISKLHWFPFQGSNQGLFYTWDDQMPPRPPKSLRIRICSQF